MSKLYWILSEQDITLLEDSAPALVRKLLNSSAIFVLQDHDQQFVPDGQPTRIFASYSNFITAVRNHSIPSRVHAVAYDPEIWAQTPKQEKDQPQKYMTMFAKTARRNGYTAILIPGRDLLLWPGDPCTKQHNETLDAAYLRCGLPSAASYAPIFEIQSAPSELDIPKLRDFVDASARQARQSNPKVALIATLSTLNANKPVTERQLMRAAKALLPTVRGFQLNLTPHTFRVAAAFLQKLSTESSGGSAK